MKLYKYRPIDIYLNDIFTEKKIWFPNRLILNDPEDLLLTVVNDVNTDVYKEFILSKSKKEKWPKRRLRYNLQQISGNNGLSNAAKEQVGLALRETQVYLDGIGILSLSEDADNEILWFRYGDEGKGICLEFELNQSEHLLKVIYAESRPKLKLSDLMISEDAEKIFKDVLRTKTSKWINENEWRYFAREGNTKFNFLGYITGIRFGRMASQEDKCRIMELIDSTKNKIVVY